MVLKLGTQTGSLNNHLYSRMTKGQPEPVVGMGATLLSWTDRNPATIIDVKKIKFGWVVTVQEDDAELIGGSVMSEDQTYKYTANPKAAKKMYRYEEGKGWREVRDNGKGRLKLTGGGGLRIGEREKYRDPSF